jgi:hypothetical protein
VGSFFLRGYYSVLANTPELARQFYTAGSTVVRLDCETLDSVFGETLEVRINPIWSRFCCVCPPLMPVFVTMPKYKWVAYNVC